MMQTVEVHEVKRRLATSMAAMVKLTKMWKNKAISINAKLSLMKALVWPVATYGSEAWTLNKQEGETHPGF